MTLKLRAKFDPQGNAGEPVERPRPGAPIARLRLGGGDATATPAARNLALAYHLARAIDQGLLPDYTAAARLLGVSQPRLTHLMGLLMLAPQIQDAILLGKLDLGDKVLRRLARVAEWREQLTMVAG